MAAALVPGDEATYPALTTPTRRLRPRQASLTTASSNPRQGPALPACWAEQFGVLLGDHEALELLAGAATQLVHAQVPAATGSAIGMAARLAALQKPIGGVGGIAIVFRRLVSRTIAQQWANVFDAAMRPFQYALQARAGTRTGSALEGCLGRRPSGHPCLAWHSELL